MSKAQEHPEDQTPPGMIAIARGVLLPRNMLNFTYTRSSGPGGQNVNKLSTRVQMRIAMSELESIIGYAPARRLERFAASHLTSAGELLIVCDETRSQVTNRQRCVEKLLQLIRQSMIKPRVRRKTKPSRAAKARRLEQKKQRASKKNDRKRPRADD